MRALALVAVGLVCTLAAGAASSTSPRVRLISASWDGRWADGFSHEGAMSGSGRYVVFVSGAQNIVRSGGIGFFVRDVRRNKTKRFFGRTGTEVAATPDAQVVVFCTREPLARGDIFDPGKDPGLFDDVYVYNRRTRKVMRASVPAWDRARKRPDPACGGYPPEINVSYPDLSGDGRFVVFSSKANNLVRRDTNGTYDVFVRDLVKQHTSRASVSSAGRQANDQNLFPTITRDGRYVFFCSLATNLARPGHGPRGGGFVRDLKTGTTKAIVLRKNGRRLAPASSCPIAYSDDGRFLAFTTWSPDLVGDLENAQADHDLQLVVQDRRTGAYDVITRGLDGKGADHSVLAARLSLNGRYIVFTTNATNLVPGDTNLVTDVFWFDRVRRTTTRVSVRADGAEAYSQNGSVLYSMSMDGRFVSWESPDPLIVPGEPRRPPGDDTTDVFITGPLH
jgi:hypothetical protein